jgi:hypothetical protein
MKEMSDEEIYFKDWLDEAIKEELVEMYTFQPNPFKLSYEISFPEMNGKKQVKNLLLNDHEYRADFTIYWGLKAFKIDLVKYIGDNDKEGIFQCQLHNERPISVVDVKGAFGLNKNDQRFPLNQKWVYSKYRIYVQKIVPFGSRAMKKCLFNLTWTPKSYAFRPRKDGKGNLMSYVDTIRMIDEYLNTKQ